MAASLLLLAMISCNPVRFYANRVDKKLTRTGFYTDYAVDQTDTVFYHAGGRGTPVLLVHGFGGDGLSNWMKQMRVLSEDFQVIVPDLLWFGESTSISKPSLQGQAEAMFKVLDHLEIKSAQLCGLSYGGFVVMEMYRQQPDRVASLVIVDSPGPIYPDSSAREFNERWHVASSEEFFVPKDHKELKRLLRAAFYKDKKLPGCILKGMYTAYFSEHEDEKSLLLKELQSEPEKYREIDVVRFPPGNVIWGIHDEVFPLASGQALADYMEGSFMPIEEAGHTPQMEKPKEFNALFIQFLKQVEADAFQK